MYSFCLELWNKRPQNGIQSWNGVRMTDVQHRGIIDQRNLGFPLGDSQGMR